MYKICWNLYICIHVYISALMTQLHICMCVYIKKYIQMFSHIHICHLLPLCVSVRVWVERFIYECAHTIHKHTQTHTHTHQQTHTHTRIHTFTHAQILTRSNAHTRAHTPSRLQMHTCTHSHSQIQTHLSEKRHFLKDIALSVCVSVCLSDWLCGFESETVCVSMYVSVSGSCAKSSDTPSTFLYVTWPIPVRMSHVTCHTYTQMSYVMNIYINENYLRTAWLKCRDINMKCRDINIHEWFMAHRQISHMLMN